MAKAIAICKCATCGQEFEVTAIKPSRRDADSWEKWAVDHYDECHSCYEARKKAQQEEESRKAAADAKEAGLPELKGSEKQIAWAEKIRMSFVTKIDEEIEFTIADEEQEEVDILTAFKAWVLKKDEARFWIDYRDAINSSVVVLFDRLASQFEADQAEETFGEPEIVEPEEKRSSTVCTVDYTADIVKVSSKYDPDMPDVVKAAGFKWDRAKSIWYRKMNYATGKPSDRAAEIANKLLLAGFPVKLPADIQETAVRGTYEPEHKRWIAWDPKKEMLSVNGIDSTGLPGAKGQFAPLSAYDAIEEFAQLHDCRLSPGAQQRITEYKAKVVKVAPQEGQEAEYNDTADSVKDILNSSRDVLEDLKED